MNLLRMVARPLLAAPFVADGIDAVRDPRSHVARIAPARPLIDRAASVAGVEADDGRLVAATRALGAVTAVAGVGFALGRAPRVCAAVLAVVGAPVALAPRTGPAEEPGRAARRSAAMRRLALVGGALIASTDRVGAPSASWARRARRERAAAVRAAREGALEQAAAARGDAL